jgi:hypothetical protein
VSDGIPERHVIFDTEAHRTITSSGERQTFSLAAAEYLRFTRDAGPEIVKARAYDAPEQLWEDILRFTRSRHRTIVWCHNLAYDLRVARGLEILPEMGLELKGIVLDYTSSWAKFAGGGRSLLCCDITSWLPHTLKTLGKDLGQRPTPLPGNNGDRQLLLKHCARDVQITRSAVEEILRLVTNERLGPWRATGAGQSHAAWRRRFMSTSPLCHDDEDALTAERRAMWTGRCEAWRWGKIKHSPVWEYDLALAYPAIAASEQLPEALIGRAGAVPIQHLLAKAASRAVLADVTVTTDTPLVPCAANKLIHWPVGTFRTTLWDPELQLLAEHQAQVHVHQAWLYTRGDALKAFSSWLLDAVQDGGGEHSQLQRRALKHMSRAVVGRFAMRYRSWEEEAQMPDSRLRLGEEHDLRTGERWETLQVGHTFMTLGGHELAEDAAPQITGWVMSECRRRLYQLVLIAGEEHVLYMDTDSLIVTSTGAERLNMAIDRGEGWGLRVKHKHPRLTINGPRQLQLGAHRRLAGVPSDALQVKPGVYEGEMFSGLRESIAQGDAGAVMVQQRQFKMTGIDTRRLHLPDGQTAPHVVG